MDAHTEQKTIRMIARHDQCLRRAARMLAANARGDKLPPDAEFHPDELQSLDSNTADLAVELLGAAPDEADWLPPVRFAYRHGYMTKPGPMTWLESFEKGLRLSKRYFESFLSLSQKEVHVGDKITVGAAHVVMGSHASAGDIETHGDVTRTEGPDLSDLVAVADQLAILRKALLQHNSVGEIERDIDVGVLASAEKEARAGNRNKMLAALKLASTWVLDVATKIGVELAASVIKSASGLSP
ncbi:MAG TPA: hypothetical protein VNZ26_25570 [Vicinamibacterales bacterium]|jgi:hypothetical protein|nr:hypothetical protein [Vicinamibacterales bacterium]